MCNVISVNNAKGGQGKTAITYNVAALLASQGDRVLMIDNDCQASLTLACGYNPLDFEKTIVDVYLKNEDIRNAIVDTDIEKLKLCPSSIRLSKAELTLISKIARESVLKKAIDSVRDLFDYIIIDNAPSLSILCINSLVAADYVLIPCTCEDMSVYALDDVFDVIEEIKTINTDLKVAGIALSMFDGRVNKQKEIKQQLEKDYKVLGLVPRSAEMNKGVELGKPVVINNPRCNLSGSLTALTYNLWEVMNNGKTAR